MLVCLQGKLTCFYFVSINFLFLNISSLSNKLSNPDGEGVPSSGVHQRLNAKVLLIHSCLAIILVSALLLSHMAAILGITVPVGGRRWIFSIWVRPFRVYSGSSAGILEHGCVLPRESKAEGQRSFISNTR